MSNTRKNSVENQDDSKNTPKTSHSNTEKKATHSEIEKRRRQKMNKHLNELVFHLPVSTHKNKKLDKITILKLAVQHMKNLKKYKVVHFTGYLRSDLSSNLKYTDPELSQQHYQQQHQHHHADSKSSNFYENMSSQLAFDSNNPTSNSFIPFNSAKSPIDNNNSSSSTSNNNTSSSNTTTTTTTTTTTSSSSLSSSSSKTLFTTHHSITLLNTNNKQLQQQQQQQLPAKYSSSLTTESVDMCTNQPSSNTNPTIQYYLIAYGQTKPKTDEYSQFFVSRYDVDGKIIYIEPSVHSILGYLPQQLLSESIFNHIHADDVPSFRQSFQDAINEPKTRIKTRPYRVRLENNKSYISIESIFHALQNPFSGHIEYLIAQNKQTQISTIISTSSSLLAHQQQQQQQGQTSTGVSSIAGAVGSATASLSSIHNLSNISLPMTPSPEEIIYGTNDSMLNADRLLNTNLNSNELSINTFDLIDYLDSNMNLNNKNFNEPFSNNNNSNNPNNNNNNSLKSYKSPSMNENYETTTTTNLVYNNRLQVHTTQAEKNTGPNLSPNNLLTSPKTSNSANQQQQQNNVYNLSSSSYSQHSPYESRIQTQTTNLYQDQKSNPQQQQQQINIYSPSKMNDNNNPASIQTTNKLDTQFNNPQNSFNNYKRLVSFPPLQTTDNYTPLLQQQQQQNFFRIDDNYNNNNNNNSLLAKSGPQQIGLNTDSSDLVDKRQSLFSLLTSTNTNDFTDNNWVMQIIDNENSKIQNSRAMSSNSISPTSSVGANLNNNNNQKNRLGQNNDNLLNLAQHQKQQQHLMDSNKKTNHGDMNLK